MGAFTSTDIQQYQARYAIPKTKPGYSSIKPGRRGPTVIKTPKKENNGIWMFRPFDPENCPVQRIGHCTINVPQFNGVVICYGCSSEQTLLSDLWFFNFVTNTWMEKQIDQSSTSPRAGARAVIIENELWVFGGSNETGILDDLHVINLVDGSIRRPDTNGPQPSPRVNHVMAAHGNKILIYGGSSETVLSDLFILDTTTLTWTQIEISHGRSSASFCMFDGQLYVYGGSSTPGFLRFNFSNNDGEIVPVKGIIPSSAITNATLVQFDRYFVLIGGDFQEEHEEESSFAPIYLYDIDQELWSIFPISPDYETTSVKDGELDKAGNFKLPLVSQCTAVYDPLDREIHIFMGYPPPNSPLESVIQISTPLTALHMQTDMLAVLRMAQ